MSFTWAKRLTTCTKYLPPVDCVLCGDVNTINHVNYNRFRHVWDSQFFPIHMSIFSNVQWTLWAVCVCVCQRRHPTTEFNDKVFMLIGQWAFIQRSACSSTHQMIQIHFGSPIMGYSNRQRFNVVSSRIRRIRGDGRSWIFFDTQHVCKALLNYE